MRYSHYLVVWHSGFLAGDLNVAVPTTIQSIPFPRSIAFFPPTSFYRLSIHSKHENNGFLLRYCQRILCKCIDSQSSVSTVSSSFGQLIIYWQQQNGIPIAVITTMGAFSCLVNLLPEPIDTTHHLKLGRDGFSYCTTLVPDAQIPLLHDMLLVFSSSPFLQCTLVKQVSFLRYNLILHCLILLLYFMYWKIRKYLTFPMLYLHVTLMSWSMALVPHWTTYHIHNFYPALQTRIANADVRHLPSQGPQGPILFLQSLFVVISSSLLLPHPYPRHHHHCPMFFWISVRQIVEGCS